MSQAPLLLSPVRRVDRLAPLMLGAATGPFARACGVIVALCAATLCVWSGWRAHTASEAARVAQSQLDQQRRAVERPARGQAPVAPALAPAQAAVWNQMTRQLNMPWPRLLDLLESRTPQDVALLSIEPDVKRRTVRLTAESRRLERLLDLVEVMREDPMVADVVLQRHETNDQDAQQPTRLSLELRLKADMDVAPLPGSPE